MKRQNINSCRSSIIVPRSAFKSITYRTKINPQQSNTIPTSSCKRQASTAFWQSQQKLIKIGKQGLRRYSEAGNKSDFKNYLNIFDSHMSLSKKSRLIQKQQLLRKAKITVKLPLVFQNPASNFTVLEPVQYPIEDIEMSIKKLNKTLLNIKQQNRQTREQFQKISPKINNAVDQIQISTISKLKQLRQSIKNDCIRHQSFKLQSFKGILEIKQYIDEVEEGMNESIIKTVEVQKEIFQNQLPFELQMQQENGEIVQSFF